MDVYDRLQPDDMKQMSVIVAAFVYQAAMRDQMFPRKPIEKPLPPVQDDQVSPVTNPAAADRPAQPLPAQPLPAEQRPVEQNQPNHPPQ